MTYELWMLVLSAVLLLALIFLASMANASVKGFMWNFGNRSDPVPHEGWPGRAERAYRNMLETFPIFIALIIVAHFANIHSPATVLGAQLYFWSRVAHAAVYHAGIAYVRTLIWFVGVYGFVLIFKEILKSVPPA